MFSGFSGNVTDIKNNDVKEGVLTTIDFFQISGFAVYNEKVVITDATFSKFGFLRTYKFKFVDDKLNKLCMSGLKDEIETTFKVRASLILKEKIFTLSIDTREVPVKTINNIKRHIEEKHLLKISFIKTAGRLKEWHELAY